MKTLTRTIVSRLKPRKRRYDQYHNGLHIWVTPSGKVGFSLLTHRNNERISEPIGVFKDNKIDADDIEAINLRLAKFHLDLQSPNPRSSYKASMGEVFDAFMADKSMTCKPETIATYASRIHVLKPLRPLQIKELTKGCLLKNVQHIRSRSYREACLIMLRNIMNWAVQHDYIQSNPWSAMPKMTHRRRLRVLERNEIVAIWPHLYPIHKFLLLTGQRLGEVRKMEWKDLYFDSDGVRWKQPDNKTSTPHILGLPSLAVSQLPESTDRTGVVFRGRYGDKPYTSNEGIRKPLHRAYLRLGIENATVHDLRRTALTNIADLMQSGEIAERVANHALGNIAARYNLYSYEEPKAEALRRWAGRVQDWVDKE